MAPDDTRATDCSSTPLRHRKLRIPTPSRGPTLERAFPSRSTAVSPVASSRRFLRASQASITPMTFKSLLTLLVVPALLHAQDTPTERAAASEVVKKMAALQ